MKQTVIDVCSRKGGVGKTAIASTVASLLARDKRSVVLLDLDTQSSAASALGLDPLAAGSAEWLSEQTANFQEAQAGLRLLSGGPSLERVRMDPAVLSRKLVTLEVEFVVIDTAPGAGDLSRAATAVANHVLVVTEPHPLGLAGAVSILQGGLGPTQRRALILSRLDTKRALHRAIQDGAADAFDGMDVFPVRNDVFFERGLAAGTLAATMRRTKAIEDLNAIVSWILEGNGVRR